MNKMKPEPTTLILTFIIGFISAILILNLAYSPVIEYNYNYSSITFKNIKYDGNFTDNEILRTKIILSYIKPYYFRNVKSITFTKGPLISTKDGDRLWGVNIEGDITILYREDKIENDMAHTICHEILHTLLNLEEDEEQFVKDLTKGIPCYYQNV